MFILYPHSYRQMAGFIIRVRVGSERIIAPPGHVNELGACSWGWILRGGGSGGSGGGTSLPRHPRPLRCVQVSLLYKPTGCRELGDDIEDLLC